jgi:hypothetical protein
MNCDYRVGDIFVSRRGGNRKFMLTEVETITNDWYLIEEIGGWHGKGRLSIAELNGDFVLDKSTKLKRLIDEL